MLEKFHLRGGGNQDPGYPGVGKVRGGRIFFLQAGGGDWPWMTLCYDSGEEIQIDLICLIDINSNFFISSNSFWCIF